MVFEMQVWYRSTAAANDLRFCTRPPNKKLFSPHICLPAAWWGNNCVQFPGLAIAVGTWASIMVIVNFVFGILVFKEPVADIWGTLGAFLLLIVGLVGMSKYSAPQQHPKEDTPQEFYDAVQEDPPNDGGVVETAGFRNDGSYQSTSDAQQIRKRATEGDGQVVEFGTPFTLTADDGDRDDISPLSPDGITLANGDHNNDGPYILLFSGRLPLTKRQCGILGAAMNGVMTGGSLIPLHYAKDEGFGGARYFPSMACGALLSNALLWCIWFAHNAWSDHRHHGKTLRDTLMEMPKWEFRVLWMPAFLAGLLLSIAMFTSILAVTYLGQGVGNSLVQTKILVSGLWGIFWYHEIVGFTTIAKWFASAGVCIVAIIWLSMERLEATGGGGH